jgi:hypothetical protein
MYNGLNLSGGTTRQTNVLEFVDEMKEITYMVGLLVFFSFLLTIFVKSNNMLNFLNTEESFLISYYVILIMCCLIMTVLPGQKVVRD